MGSRPRRHGRSLARAALAVAVVGGCQPSPDQPARETGGHVERVVSLIPAATEIVFALGAGGRLVGRTRWGVHPPEAANVADVGDGIRPSLETVVARSPDLVILFEGPDNEGVAARLADLGIRTLALTHNSLVDLERNVRALGDALGCPASARELNERIAADLETVSAATRGLERPSVYYDVWADPPMTIGRGSFLDSLITLAGGRNVFGDLERPSPRVGLETIVLRDPDLIVRAVRTGGLTDDALGDRPGWDAIPAVGEQRVVFVDADLLGRLGPRAGEAALHLARALHPEVSLSRVASPPELSCTG